MWIEPKTNWTSKDWFNIEDYNRIKNNIDEIHNQSLKLYPDFSYEEMGEDKTYEDYYYADEINKMENNLEFICKGTFPFVIGEKQQYYDNQPFIDFNGLNRIESACKVIYRNLMGQQIGIQRLELTLGRRRYPG